MSGRYPITSMKERQEKKEKDLRKQKEYHSIFNQWRDYDFITTILAMIGLALAVANYEIEMLEDFGEYEPNNFSKDRHPHPKNLQRNMVKVIVFVTTVLAVGCLTMRHYYKILWLNKYFHQDNETHLYYQFNEIIIGKDPAEAIMERKRFLTKTFFMEVLILMICPLPYVEKMIEI